MSAPGLAAIFFDLDGTLAESLPALEECYRRFLAGFGRSGTPDEFARLVGPTIPEIAEILRRRHGLPGEPRALADRYLEVVREAYGRDVVPRAGARDALELAHGSGAQVLVVTSAPESLAAAFLEAHGLARWVHGVVSGEGLPHGKPAPDVYCDALARAGVAASRALAVEDSLAGVLSATGAEIPTLFLTDRPATDLPELRGRAAWPIADLAEASERIRGRLT